MKDDKRSYERYKVDINAIIYGAPGYCEIKCKVKDISEEGISFDVMQCYKDSFKIGDYISFQFYDILKIGQLKEGITVTEKGLIRHIEKKGEQIRIGCYLNTKTYRHYIIYKELSKIVLRYIKTEPS